MPPYLRSAVAQRSVLSRRNFSSGGESEVYEKSAVLGFLVRALPFAGGWHIARYFGMKPPKEQGKIKKMMSFVSQSDECKEVEDVKKAWKDLKNALKALVDTF